MYVFEHNAAILRELAGRGVDLARSRSVDFSHVFADRASAEAFARESVMEGFTTEVEEVERKDDPWDVTVSKQMVPTCENITTTEEQLDFVARPHGGRADGWGFLD